ncbi:MSCS-like 2 [Actinidia rufa]|uniref:MSCS-like 2 n=1 Tax=Actinidia rufa TaxID=165716 RepID=A0A7J0DYS8_9ERIC|nr:MSCS-like 2 [Actinidia rufa]
MHSCWYKTQGFISFETDTMSGAITTAIETGIEEIMDGAPMYGECMESVWSVMHVLRGWVLSHDPCLGHNDVFKVVLDYVPAQEAHEALVLIRSYNSLCGSPIVFQLVPAVGIIAFAAWGLGPLMRLSRIHLLHMGFQFTGKAVYTAVWVAAVSLFMELLGFSTQKWLTAGGLGTVLITLSGREHVGWWAPTILRGDDREAIHIPNHKFTMNVVRNLSQKTHWRIKTHIAISHMDFNKINNIVADMRKVLAKNPQVEQQRLHRRVFLETINPENQALMEAILLDLLRVVSHHRARLATPIRTVQKIYSEADIDNVPFANSTFTGSRASGNHPFLLIEPSYNINGDDKAKPSTRGSTPDSKETRTGDKAKLQFQDSEKQELIKHAMDGVKKAISVSGSEKTDIPFTIAHAKHEDERSIASPSVSRLPLEDNIILGVALEGSKRTLPIEEEMTPSSVSNAESKELATSSVSTDKKDDQIPSTPAASQSDQREKERLPMLFP